MFLFSRKTKTPISTYSDSYRAPTSIKEVYKDPPLWAWEANKFVTPVSTGFGGVVILSRIWVTGMPLSLCL